MSNRHPIADVRRQLELRAAEGLTFKQLALRSGIPAHVLMYRATLERRAHSNAAEASSRFVEVIASEPQGPDLRAAKSSGIELTFPSGLRATLASDFDSKALTRLVELVRC